MQTKHLCVLIHIWTMGEIGAPLNRFKPSSKIFYWPFQGCSFVDLLCFFMSCVCHTFVRICLYVPCDHLLGKGWPLVSRLWCLTVSWLLSHWYPGSGVVLDCIDSWSLHPNLLCARLFICALWSPAGKGLTSWLSLVVSNFEFVTFPLVSWVRCGTWLYRFLIFAPLLTLTE